MLDESGRKPNEICVDKSTEFYKRKMELWLQENDIEINSIHKERKHLLLRKDLLFHALFWNYYWKRILS